MAARPARSAPPTWRNPPPRSTSLPERKTADTPGHWVPGAHWKPARGLQGRRAPTDDAMAAPGRAWPPAVWKAPARITSDPLRARARTGPSVPLIQLRTTPVVLRRAAALGPESREVGVVGRRPRAAQAGEIAAHIEDRAAHPQGRHPSTLGVPGGDEGTRGPIDLREPAARHSVDEREVATREEEVSAHRQGAHGTRGWLDPVVGVGEGGLTGGARGEAEQRGVGGRDGPARRLPRAALDR